METTQTEPRGFNDTGRTFVDPRFSMYPSCLNPRRALAKDASEIADLVRLCRDGRIYAVEAWIRSGKPLWTSNDRLGGSRRLGSPLKIAIESGQYDLALLLLCNGFPPDVGHESLLGRALDRRAFRFVDLLLAWGADPMRVHVCSILETYDSALYERFWAFGVDFTKGHELAQELAGHSSNRPAYGWARRHRNDPRVARDLAMALCEAVIEERDRAVALLLWAGADPHARVPSLKWLRDADKDDPDDHVSAVMCAVTYGKGKLLPLLKPDPTLDDFNRLWSSVCEGESVDYLAKIQAPEDWSSAIVNNIHHLCWGFSGEWRIRQCVERMIAGHGARLTSLTETACKDLRRAILRTKDDSDMLWVLRWMSRPEHCEPAIYSELTRTDSMQRRFAGRGLRQARHAAR